MMAVRTIINMAAHHLGRVVREGSWIWLVGLPLTIIYVLGVTTHGLFSGDFVPPEPYPVALYDPSGSMEEWDPPAGFFELRPVEAEDEARRAVLTRQSDAAVILPVNFPEAPPTVVAVPDSVVGEILTSVLASFISGDERDVEVAEAMDESPQGERPSWSGLGSFDYYTVGITILFTMYAAHSVMIYIADERNAGVYTRTRSMGISRAQYLAAGFVGAAVTAVVFVTFMTTVTTLLFGVGWGAPLPWGVMTLLGSTSVSALSFLVMAIMPSSPKVVESAGSVVYTLLGFLGGLTVPLPAMPDWFSSALSWLPSRVMLEGHFTLVGGGAIGSIAGEIMALALTSIAFFVLAWGILGLRSRIKGEV